MNNPFLVIQAINGAFGFVVTHASACLVRAVPVMMALVILGIFQRLLAAEFGILGMIAQPMIFAVFAVSWHRYTLLPAVRNASGFPLQLGWREIKFGLASVAITLTLFFLFFLFFMAFTPVIAAVAYGLTSIMVSLLSLFLLPAIALDQPLQIGRFFSEGLSLFFSFILGIMYSFLFLGVLTVAAAGFGWLIVLLFNPEAGFYVMTFLLNITIAPFLIAVATSTASYLLHAVIGVQFDEGEAEDEEKL